MHISEETMSGVVTQGEEKVGEATAREEIAKMGYASFVPDELYPKLVYAVLKAAADYRDAREKHA